MMAALFLIYVIAMIFIWFGMRKTAMTITFINFILSLGMLWHHATTTLRILL